MVWDLNFAIACGVISTIICWPLYKYMFKAINQANNEFDKGAKSLKLSNLRSQETKEGFWYAAVAAAILPSIPNIFVAFIIYALFSFMWG